MVFNHEHDSLHCIRVIQYPAKPNQQGETNFQQKRKEGAYFCSNLLQEIFPRIHHFVISNVV